MTPRLPRRRAWRVAIYLLCLLLVLLAVDLLLANARRTIHPGYQTTRIIAPAQENGAIDYLAAVESYFSRGVTPENNAAPLLLEALGRAALPRTQPPDGITQRLGMAHLPEEGDYLITYETFTKDRGGEPADPDVLDNSQGYTWPREPSPVTTAWLKANERPLEKVIEATKRPRYFIPFDGGNRPQMMFSVLLPHVNLIRSAGRALLTRALVRANAGDGGGCRADLLASHRLARLIGQAPTLVERVSGMSLEIAACRADRVVAAEGRFSAQARALAAGLAALPDLGQPAECVDASERYMVLDFMQYCARANPTEAGRMFQAGIGNGGGIPPAQLFRFLPIPYERSMIAANQWYDGALAALRQPSYAMRYAAMQQWEQDIARFDQSNHWGFLSPRWMLRVFMPALMRPQQRWETARAENRLSQVALALAAFKSDHNGAYPATLSELSPDYLREIPADNFTDRPLIYSRTAAGYVLYSVGPNMLDDGGNNHSPADDIVASQK